MVKVIFVIMACLVVLLATSCATAPGKERGKVVCPACGTDFDALYEKRF